MKLIKSLHNSLQTNSRNAAFCFNGAFYTYSQLSDVVSRIRKAIADAIPHELKIVGLVANDDIETYAAIIALWFEGKVYVPINPENPKERNENIIQQARVSVIIDSSEQSLFSNYTSIRSKELVLPLENNALNAGDEDKMAYLLFTSGTTGVPKGVPILVSNLEAFVKAFWNMGFEINETDRCLQMFELTFDLSVMSFLIPLLKGACIYTIPRNKIKFSYIYELMEEHKLTVALMVPSMLHFLRPYFDEIDLPDMRYSLFCGEALSLDITEEWSKCLPNAQIRNVYGPTENTIFCTYYTYKQDSENKAHNGVLSIGKAMTGVLTIIINENQTIIPSGQSGQLCLGGELLSPGYWNNPKKNSESFFELEQNGKTERFYKTGDLCMMDDDGDLLYLGRLDFQAKIQGFRVELSEIEFHAKAFLEKVNVIAFAINDQVGNLEIGLAVESGEFASEALIEYLKQKLPVYMVPRKVRFTGRFPLNANGKVDRKQLALIFDTV